MADNEGVRTREVDRCLLCGEAGDRLYSDMRDRLFRAPGVWAFLACRSCGLVWLNPCPEEADIAKLYTTYYTHDPDPPSTPGLRLSVRRAVLSAAFGYRSANGSGLKGVIGTGLSLIPAVKDRVGMGIGYLNQTDGGKLLDIGCGGGTFLARMRELGWNVQGVEPDPTGAAAAREELGLRVFNGSLEAADLPDESFDAVTVNHVIEHATDPVRLLRGAWRLVRPGGRLIVITPNVASLAHRLYRRSWYCLDPPRHLVLFSRRTLDLCAQRAGISSRVVRTSSRLAPYTWASSRSIFATGKGPPERSPTRLMAIEGLLFQMLEEFALFVNRDAGEELLLSASRSGHV